MPPSFSRRSGFSLIELSIVLVILGLLVGGILSGRSLIRAAEMRQVARQLITLDTAFNAFRNKYFYRPGDLPVAVSFWGAMEGGLANGLDADCMNRTTPGTGTQTCNGNGDGVVGYNGLNPLLTRGEELKLWQHLANAGLIAGTYTGVPGSAGIYDSVPGENVPNTGKIGYSLSPRGTVTNINDPHLYPGEYGHWIRVGLHRPNDSAIGLAFRPEETWNIDTKIDDGSPAFGRVTASKPGNPHNPDCTTGTTARDAAYKLDNDALACFFNYSRL